MMTESGGNSCVPSVASEQSSSAEIRQNSKDVRNDKEVPRRLRVCQNRHILLFVFLQARRGKILSMPLF